MKIAMSRVSVIDPIAAFMFYTKTLGFTERLFIPEMKLAIVVAPDEPNGTMLLLEPRGQHNSDLYFDGLFNAGLPVIALGTDEIEAEYESLKDKGVVFFQPPTKIDLGTSAIFDDTCGNYIQLLQPH